MLSLLQPVGAGDVVVLLLWSSAGLDARACVLLTDPAQSRASPSPTDPGTMSRDWASYYSKGSGKSSGEWTGLVQSPASDIRAVPPWLPRQSMAVQAALEARASRAAAEQERKEAAAEQERKERKEREERREKARQQEAALRELHRQEAAKVKAAKAGATMTI